MSSHHFKRLFDLQFIYAPKAFVSIDNTPIFLEIGAGKGKHAYEFATQNPDKTLIAIERTRNKFANLQALKIANDLPNLYAIHADAIAWSVFALYPKQVAKCFILYPNPEPHNKNQRWHNMPFFEFLLSRLQDNAQIVLTSNISDYISEAKNMLTSVWCLDVVCQRVQDGTNRTHFETKYLQRGEFCQELIITKPYHYRTRFDNVLPKIHNV